MLRTSRFFLTLCFLLPGTTALAQEAADKAAHKCITSLAVQQEIYAMSNKMKYLMSAKGVGSKTDSPLKGKFSAKCDANVVWEIKKDKNGKFQIIAYHNKGKLLYTYFQATAKVSSAKWK
ncbi:hypothetical protein [Deinococcus roseus]|uniref:Uncharacterized protein n=1 Tax=Deinococcus roseus TaxID=392414 RepID=A0ABQ2D0L2_9DEIO|nr:hypothetical protein [Deinococcus roseus]GGJ28047.1 hypothetical protein GCM10008938_12660 [Deinococcus roseus]